MSEYDNQLPFGSILTGDVADDQEAPLIYAESGNEFVSLQWYSSEYPNEYDEDTYILLDRRTLEEKEISQDIAELILKFNDKYWDYAE